MTSILQERPITAVMRTVLSGIIDYAGLFPPASQSMEQAAASYAEYLQGPFSFALGRFVCPVRQLADLATARAKSGASQPWHVSALLSDAFEPELSTISATNTKANGLLIDSIEVRAKSIDDIERVQQFLPSNLTAYFEIDPSVAPEMLHIIRHYRGRAKIRTGGITAEAFPEVQILAGFIVECARADVPFKATAGLHHPLRCVRPLTYAPDAPTGTMHGFLNVFLASTLAYLETTAGRKVDLELVQKMLLDGDRANWHLDEQSVTYKAGDAPIRIDLSGIDSARRNFAMSFGSCSFEEPIRDLQEANFL